MRRLPIAPTVALALAAILSAVPVALAATLLDDTDWYAVGDCYIDEIDLHADGTVDIAFDGYSDFDSGRWSLARDVLQITFESYLDVFLAVWDGKVIRAAHAYAVDNHDAPVIESCSFER